MDYGNLKVPENVTPEVQAILDSYEARNKEIENAHRKNTGRIWLGSAISGLSAHPVLNVPYVGTGLGGALYELGQGITEGDKLPELAKRTGTGFVIGETVGAIPYAGKYANKLSGGKIGNAFLAGVEKLASTHLGQKVTEIAPRIEDVLMTDIKAFNPNKQTAYHGSPYDFNKFSNEAIGTGEGAQAHGMGHYAAKNKDVADISYRKGLSGTDGVYKYKDEILPEGFHQYYDAMKIGNENTLPDILTHIDQEMSKTENLINRLKNNSVPLQEPKDLINAQNLLSDYDKIMKAVADFENVKLVDSPKGQLYKLSIPKDDVMLREDLPINQQPKAVQDAINKINQKLGFGNYDDLSKQSLDVSNQIKNQYNFQNIDWQKVRELESLQDEITKKMTAVNPNIIGKNYYKSIGKNSNLLNQHGIKGISYNGGMDGEARVIFNPDDIDIVRKYYNQPSLGEMLLKKSPNAGATSNYLYDLMTRE